MEDTTIKIEQLQKWRMHKRRDLRLDQALNSFCRSLRKSSKQLSQVQDAWLELVPQQLLQVSMPVALRNGTVEVVVDCAPTAYHVNRLIRGGLLRKLQKCCSGTLRTIRVRVE